MNNKKNKELKIIKVGEMEEKKEIAPQNQNPASLIALAIQQGTPIETIEKLMDLQDRWDKKQAKIAFDNDMAELQGELPIIQKNKMARDESRGKDLYKYAPLDDITEQTKEPIMRHGFSYSFKTVNTSDKVSVTCIVKHKLGHSEESVMETGLATKTQIMSGPQQIAATVTFNKRYAFCNAFGIMTGDEDKEEAVKFGEVVEKKDTTNYIDKLKLTFYKKCGKTLPEALESYNKMTGLNAKAMPTTNDEAKKMLDNLTNSPAFNQQTI